MQIPLMTGGTLSLTHFCNLTCSYCFTGGRGRKRMTSETGKKCIDFLLQNTQDANINLLPGKKRQSIISFWGGEPLLEWELMQELASYAVSSRFKDVIVNFEGTTNGTLLTPEKFSFLEDHQIFFLISLDGTEKTHNRFRTFADGKGSHSTIMKNMEAVLKRWPFSRARMSIYPDAVENFYEDVRYLAQNGFRHIMFSPVYELEWKDKDWIRWETECKKVVDLIVFMRRKGIDLIIQHFASFMQGGEKYPCGAGRWFIHFDTEGAIYPCHRFAKFPDDRPWEEKEVCIGHIEHGITRPEFRDEFVNWNPAETECKNCNLLKIAPCAGGCYASNYDFMGNIRIHPSSLCNYIKMQKRVSDYLATRLKFEFKQVMDNLWKEDPINNKSTSTEEEIRCSQNEKKMGKGLLTGRGLRKVFL